MDRRHPERHHSARGRGEAAIYANYAFNESSVANPVVNVQNITTINSGVSVLVATCKGLVVESVTSNNASAPTTNKTLLPYGFRGQTANLWSSELISLSNLINDDVNGNALNPLNGGVSGAGTPILVESQCRSVTIQNCQFTGAIADGALANTVAAGIAIQGASQVALLDNTLSGFNVCVLIDEDSSFIPLPSDSKTLTPTGNVFHLPLPAQTQHPLDGISTVSPWLNNTVIDSKDVSRLLSVIETVQIPTALNAAATETFFNPAASPAKAAYSGILAGLVWKLSAPVTAGSLRVRLYVGEAYSYVYTVANGTPSGSALIDFCVDWLDNIVFNAGDSISVEVIASDVVPAGSVEISFTASLCYDT